MKISYSQVESYCNELHALAKNMKDLLDTINNISKKVESSDSWSGPAAIHYINKMNNLTKNFEEAFEEIETSILYMASCAERYNAVDSSIMREICTNLNITEPTLVTSRVFRR